MKTTIETPVETTIQKLVDEGGREWEKFDTNGTHYRRVYFDVAGIAKLAGYEWDNYKSGNISSARHDGGKISNSEMQRVFAELDGKFWYDALTNKFMERTRYASPIWADVVIVLQGKTRNN